MDLGVDGIFIDNCAPVSECYGDKFGKHKHLDDKTNTEMYYELLKKIYPVVKSYGNDKIVMQNTGILPDHWSYCGHANVGSLRIRFRPYEQARGFGRT